MNLNADPHFWTTLQALLNTHKLVIDRPSGVPHPRYPDLIYPLDYGYIEGTTAGDGDGIDLWIGSLGGKTLTGILCTFDTVKRDAELKLLAGCTAKDIETIQQFYTRFMRTLYLPKPEENP